MQHLNFQKIGRQFSQVAPFILLLSDMILSKKKCTDFPCYSGLFCMSSVSYDIPYFQDLFSREVDMLRYQKGSLFL
jgi:hypothetical protein